MLHRLRSLVRSAPPAPVDLARPPRPVMEELAPITGGQDITRGLVDGLPLLTPLDPLAGRDGGLMLDTYVAALTDAQVFAALQQRRLAVVSTEWEVIPGGTRRADKKAAELIEAVLDALPWDQITARMHFGVYYGQAVAECLWMRDGASIVPDQIRVRDPRRFGYRPSGEQVLLTTTNPLGDPLPDRKFWTFRTGAWHDDEPYGMGIAHWCYWPVAFKRGIAKLWLVNLDKYASPTALGRFPPSASDEERAKLLAALAAIRSQAAIILPEGMEAELLSADRSGAADYFQASGYWDAAISKVILGHSAGADSTPGKLGGEDGASEVRADLVQADADVLCASANQSWVRWVAEWSVPGAVPPRIWRRTEEDEDLGIRAEREAKIYTMGFRPTLAQVIETYGGEWEPVSPQAQAVPQEAAPEQAQPQAPGDPAAPPPAPPRPPEQTSDLAAPVARPDPIAAQLDRLEREAAPLVDGLLATVRAELDQAADMPAFAARLLELYPDLDTADLTDLLARAFAATELAGRDEAR